MESSGDIQKVFSNPSNSKHSKSQGSSLADLADPKRRYAAVIQQEKEQERSQLQQKLERQKHEQQRAHQKHLKAEITKRKKELQHLEREQESGLEESKRAAHQADLKKQKDAAKRRQDAERAQTADQKSKTRYREAKQRQKAIDIERNAKRIQADHLRKTHHHTETEDRAQATKFNRSLVEKQAKQEERRTNLERTAMEDYRKGLSLHGFSQKLLDKSKPITLVFKENEEDSDAITKAQREELRNSEKEKLRVEAQQKNRRIAQERSSQLHSKLQRQREYEAYCKEAEEEQRRYNLRRLEAGKHNQFAGLKPMTLSQIDLNKKLRTQKQFERMFIHGGKAESGTAGRYKITENKMVDVAVQPQKVEKWVKQPINYADHESLIPGISEGHYSFQSEPEDAPNQEASKATMKPIIKEAANQPESANKTRLKETRLSNDPPKQELDYSDSEEDSNI